MQHALIIDDDVKNLNVMTEILNLEGLSSTQIHRTYDLEESINKLSDVHIVFLDLEMPGMDGYEVFAYLKNIPSYQDIPIVACTVHISEISVARELGFDSFISKPIDLDLFPQQLAMILSGEEVWHI